MLGDKSILQKGDIITLRLHEWPQCFIVLQSRNLSPANRFARGGQRPKGAAPSNFERSEIKVAPRRFAPGATNFSLCMEGQQDTAAFY